MINNISLVNRGVKKISSRESVLFVSVIFCAFLFLLICAPRSLAQEHTKSDSPFGIIQNLFDGIFKSNLSEAEQLKEKCESLKELDKAIETDKSLNKSEVPQSLRDECKNQTASKTSTSALPFDPKFPYAQYGLNYTIPIRDTSIKPRDDLANVIQRGQLSSYRLAKVEYIPTIISLAVKLGWNPAFFLTLWLEETGGSMYTMPPYGAGAGEAVSHMGCNPFGDPRTIEHEVENCVDYSFRHFTNDQFPNFMARYSTGSCTAPCAAGDRSCRDDIKADLMQGICTGDPFRSPNQKADNPHFPNNIRRVYALVVGSESSGGLVEYDPMISSERVTTSNSDATNTPYSSAPQTQPGTYVFFPQGSSPAYLNVWGNEPLPHNGKDCVGSTYASHGCALASAAMIYSTYTGDTTNPFDFTNKLFIPNSYGKTCLMEYETFAKILKSKRVQTGAVRIPSADIEMNSAAGHAILDPYLNAGSTLFMYGKIKGHEHFIWVVEKSEDGGYLVMDPYWGAEPLVATSILAPMSSRHYGSAIMKSFLPIQKL